MAPVDLPLEELKRYRPERNIPCDLDAFWKEKLDFLRARPISYSMEKIDYIIPGINIYDIIYKGYADVPICGHYLTPKDGKNFPVVLVLNGYTGNKGPISAYIRWPLIGFAVFAIDIRCQSGEIMDNGHYGGLSSAGYMTKGIFNKDEYYYLGAYLDCVRAIDFLADREEIDMERLCVEGISQGGGLSLATAALDGRPKLCVPQVPYLCHYRRAVEWVKESKNLIYFEIAKLINAYPESREEIFETLSYFDNLNLCHKIKAKTFMTCILKDPVCPPSTVFAVYNYIKAEKDIKVMPFYGHDYGAGSVFFDEKKVEFIYNNL